MLQELRTYLNFELLAAGKASSFMPPLDHRWRHSEKGFRQEKAVDICTLNRAFMNGLLSKAVFGYVFLKFNQPVDF